jgi:hypothetical protein
MLEEYSVLISLMGFLLSYKIYKIYMKKKHEKILERVYNPLEKAIAVLHLEIENDKTSIKGDSFKNFETAYLDVKENYGHLIDDKTNKYIYNLYRANEDLDPYDEEKYKNFVALTGIVRTHMGHKVKEINEKLQ